MRMKKLLLIGFVCLAAILFPGTAEAQDSIKIAGRLTGELTGGITLSVVNPIAIPAETYTTVSAQDGTFGFVLPGGKISIYKIYIAPDNFIILLSSEGDVVDLTLDKGKLNLNPVIRGSVNTEILYRIAIRSSLADKKVDSINNAFIEAQSKEETKYRIPVIQQAYELAVEQQKIQLKNDILANISSPAVLFFIDKLDIMTDFDLFSQVSDVLFKTYPDFKLVAELKQKVDLEKKLLPGMPAPEISLPDKEGRPITLSSLRGNVVLIDFWASWCSPCRKENPEVVKLYNRYHAKGFDIYGVSLDRDAASWVGAIAKDGLVWNQVSDLKYWQSKGAEAYGVKSIPHTVLIDRDGNIIARKLRGEALESKLEEIFGKN